MSDDSRPYHERIVAAQRLSWELRRFAPLLVKHARAAGHSWGEIGAALGISKQAAQQKYGAL
jgi:hypothetical protein